MVNYQQGKIYKIECNLTGLIYVGSTCQPTLAKRLAEHVKGYNCYLRGTSNYITSYKIITNGDYDISLLESYACDLKDELHKSERYYTNQIECVNKYKNQGLFNELGKKEYTKQYNNNYHNEHKEEIHQRKQTYRVNNKEKLQHRQKIYDNNRKDQRVDYKKQYYENNKEKLKENRKIYDAEHKLYVKDILCSLNNFIICKNNNLKL